MSDHYRHPDLSIRIKNPNEARIFMDDPRSWEPYEKSKFIMLWGGTMIDIQNTQLLPDEIAIEAAFVLLEDLKDRVLKWESKKIDEHGREIRIH